MEEDEGVAAQGSAPEKEPEKDRGKEPDKEDELVVESSLVTAYVVNTLKDVFLLGALLGIIYLVDKFLGRDFFIKGFDILGVPLEWGLYVLIGLAVFIFGATFFSTLALTSYGIILKGDAVTFSYGTFLKRTRETKMTNIVKVNFESYGYFGVGDIVVELSGTEEKDLRVRYVAKVKDVCEAVNDLVRQKKSGPALSVDASGGADGVSADAGSDSEVGD